MEGDVDGVMDRPAGEGSDTHAEREKWYGFDALRIGGEPVDEDRDAWNRQNGLSKTEAKRRYIHTLIETMHKYASNTQDARELVSELEFVWDQIKSNVPSSSSSPLGDSGLQDLPGKAAGKAGMRVLSPLSQDDDAGIADETLRDAQEDAYDDGDLDAGAGTTLRDSDDAARDRKWRRRVEQALVRMTAELAALREQMETRQMYQLRRRRGLWAWILWLLASSLKHVLIDALVLCAAMVWLRRKGDRRLEQGLVLGYALVRERVRRLR
ncbi:MAG: hypothetical protein M1832_006051 [Thelocarpon impressellum]|nr:MAG: hypothetical protein M1832_006051 [Thelocarpon impressellum]